MGVAFLECPRPVRALCRPARQATQEDNRLWARQALLLVRRWWPEREIVAVADSAYASLRLLASCRRFLPRPVTFVTRLRLDAALYERCPTTQSRSVGQAAPEGRTPPKPFGRRRGSGHRLGSCENVDDWYGGGERTVEVASATALWYSTGLPAVSIRWVLVRDPQGAFATQALLCTDLGADPEDPEQILGGSSCAGR